VRFFVQVLCQLLHPFGRRPQRRRSTAADLGDDILVDVLKNAAQDVWVQLKT
jgi:hypothetical protein